MMLVMGLMYAPCVLAQRAPFESALTPDGGKLPLTAGFTDIDGTGGGGLVPWALISGYGSKDSWGANAHYTDVQLRDFRLSSYGVAFGVADRIEASVASDTFTAALAPIDGLTVEQRVYGLKVRLTGDALYDQDSWQPQTAVGFEYKTNSGISGASGIETPRQLGAASNLGTDWYLSATKIYLAQSLLLNVTLRYSNANQFGLLGFGGNLKSSRTVHGEGTLGYALSRTLAVGAEYRGAPHNLSVDNEQAACDFFVAWAASRNVSVVGSYVRLGSILAPVTGQTRNQDGAYVSLQVGF
jgi:Protein of unknown function (DUF3034)